MKKLVVSIVVLLSSLLMAGCPTNSYDKSAINNAAIDKLAPRQLVETYYKSLAARDYRTARACLSPEYASEMYRYQDSDFKNLRSIRDIKVGKEVNMKLYGKNFDEVQVVAKYDAVYWRMTTSVDGKQIRFVYVGKKTKESPWRIISIGTGP